MREIESLRAKTRELAAADVLTTRNAALEAAAAKEAADAAAREAAAAALRLFGNDSELVGQLLGIPAEDLEREAKPVTAARAKEVIEGLRVRAGRRPRIRRTRSSHPMAGQEAAPVPPAAPADRDLGDDRSGVV
ncbi:hypothetical protein SMD44_p20076 (plasmid) [Streptomyces alboflavus]|uniref:Uncharacterized protein n=1 Tax=Streptomyces alboflavus TaxID=67267 RepID=A0A291W5L9_9ACTN|nr:hypothetical protein SMD44_p20076 [Streptomyces alboflavus]